ncbi:MAG: ligand-gated channel protein [Burkholderiaceae bacterium]
MKTLDTVVVTASGFEQNIVDAPASISVVPREKLEQGSYKDLHDALRDVPGVILTPSDNNSRDISLRGMGAQYTLILVDGKRMSTRETQANGSTGTDQSWVPPLEAIERIEIVRGPMSSLYGSDAMGGVVNIITRKVAKEWTGSVRLETTLQQHERSGDQHQGNFYLSGPLKDDMLGVTLYGVYSHRDEDRVYQGYNKYENRALTARFALTPNANHDIVFEAGTARQDYASRPDWTREISEEDSFRKFERQHYALTHNGRWGNGLMSETYAQREETKNVSRDMTITNTIFRTAWNKDLGGHFATAGFYYELNELDDTTSNSISDRSNVERWQYAFFLEDEWQMTDTFALTLGLRMDKEKTAGVHWSPRIYGVWQLADNWTLKGGVSTGFKAPSMRQTIPDWGATSRGGDRYGNPDLQPETSLTKEIGLYYQADNGLQAGFTIFHNKFEDKITRVRCVECGPPNSRGNYPTTYVNVDNAVTRGLEASISAPLTDTFSTTASYTYTDSEQKSGEYAGQPLTQLPKHMFNLSFNWEPTEKINGWTRLSFRGKESDPTGAISSSSMMAPSVTLVDFGGSYKFNKTVTMHAGVYNVFDKYVAYDDYSYVEDGRRFWLGMDIKF